MESEQMMIGKILGLYRTFGLREGSLELLHKTVGFRRYEHPFQALRVPLERLVINRMLGRSRDGFDPRRDLFRAVHIQTQSQCNYNCSYCPNGKVDRPQGTMSMPLFHKIIDDLSGMAFDGWIHLFFLSEPLMDERLPDLARIAGSACPEAKLSLQSNGSLLDEERYHQIMAIPQLHLTVNDYTPDHGVIRRIESFATEAGERRRTLLVARRTDVPMSNRAGFGQPTRFRLPLPLFCNRPFDYLFVGFDGRCPLCCCDWKLQTVVGDARSESLEKIWAGEVYPDIRKRLKRFDRSAGLCKDCDFLGYQRIEGFDALQLADLHRRSAA